jgi:hypothetical protein
MSLMNDAAGDASFGFRSRSITPLKVAASTTSFEGGENLNPFRIVNV